MEPIFQNNVSYTGGARNDRVFIRGNNVVAEGGRGDDWLTTQLNLRTATNVTSELIGGAGADLLMVSVEAEPEDDETPLTISATLDGGDGDDNILADFNSAYADQFVTVDAGDGDDTVTVNQAFRDELGEDNMAHLSESAVRAGDGDDVVSVLLWEGGNIDSFKEGAGASSTVHGSDGDDRITSDVWSWSGSDVENFLYGGDGDDKIVASASTGSDWADGQAYNRARGGDGDDRIEMGASSSGDVTNSATGDEGNDTISVAGYSLYGAVYNDISGGDGDDILTARSSAGSDVFDEPVRTAVRN